MGQAATRPVVELIDFSGGLNSAEPPDQIGQNQLADVRNLEYRRTRGLKRRRGGTENLTNATGVFAALSSVVSLFRHTPGQSETSMELWAISNDATPEVGRVAAGAAWTAVALSDAIASAAEAWFFKGVSFNGKLFLPYNSAVDYLHVWDGSSVRRVGIAASAAATVANTGAGAYAATLRYYKVQWAANFAGIGGTVFSPLSASVSFTPSGAGTAARVTLPTAPSGFSQTFWRLFGSADGVLYYHIASDVVATTTYDDSTAPSAYPDAQPASAGFPTDADTFTPPISVKYLLVDGSQLLMAGSHELVAFSSSLFYTPALGSGGFNIADDERVPTTNTLPIEPQLGGGLTGLGGPIGGTPLAFKLDRTYLLNPTTDPTLPYTQQLLSDAVGCISHQGIVLAEDEQGAPALYWPSRRGYYRYGAYGLEYCGLDIEDLWATVNLSATYGVTATYHRSAGQVWVFIPVGSDTTPSVLLKFHVQRARRGPDGVRGGWTRDDGNLAGSASVAMFSSSPAATMGLTLKPYVGKVASGGRVYKADHDTSNRDDNDAVAYTAYLQTRTVEAGMGEEFGIQTVYVQGVGDSAVTLDVSLRKDFAASDSVTAIPVALATTRGAVAVPGLEISECDVVQVRVSDQSALNQHWSLDRIGLRYRPEAPKGN
jgi:hypothetical protein